MFIINVLYCEFKVSYPFCEDGNLETDRFELENYGGNFSSQKIGSERKLIFSAGKLQQ